MPTSPLAPAGSGPAALDAVLPSLSALSGTFVSIAVALLVVILCGGGALLYLGRLQRRFLAVCRETGEIGLFASTPAGVPAGTIRATLALFLAFTGIAFLALSSLPGLERVPEFLTGVLGTVLGFYFGARSGGGPGGEAPVAPVSAEVSLPAPPAPADRQVGELQTRLEAGLEVARTVARALPGERGQQLGRAAAALQDGLTRLKQLRSSGAGAGARALAGNLLQRLQRQHPIGGLLKNIMTSFGSVLGGTFPPVALALAVVTLGAKLGGRAHTRWVARVLHSPYAVDLLTPSKFDANSVIAALRRAPVFSQAFASEVGRGDRAFLMRLLGLALADDAETAFRTAFGDRFGDPARLGAGLEEFRRALLSVELEHDMPASDNDESIGVAAVLDAVDRLHGDPAARADLDALVLIAEELRQEGHAPEVLLREAAADLEAGA